MLTEPDGLAPMWRHLSSQDQDWCLEGAQAMQKHAWSDRHVLHTVDLWMKWEFFQLPTVEEFVQVIIKHVAPLRAWSKAWHCLANLDAQHNNAHLLNLWHHPLTPGIFAGSDFFDRLDAWDDIVLHGLKVEHNSEIMSMVKECVDHILPVADYSKTHRVRKYVCMISKTAERLNTVTHDQWDVLKVLQHSVGDDRWKEFAEMFSPQFLAMIKPFEVRDALLGIVSDKSLQPRTPKVM